MATIHRTELLVTIKDLLDMGQWDVAVKVSVAIGKMEIEDHLAMLMNDDYGFTREELPTTFGDLHDSCDANEFGGLCEDVVFDKLDSMDKLCDFGNAVQNALNDMLQRGELEPQRHSFI